MGAEQLNEGVVRSFWAQKSQDDDNRWTSTLMLEHELGLLGAIAARASSILDLGSGHGHLARRLRRQDATLVAVDWEEGFARSFAGDGEQFIRSAVTDYEAQRTFDLVLLFGVVTCLPLDAERTAYRRAAAACHPDSVLVVKNQVSTAAEFSVDTFSEQLGTRYSGRYPSQDEQHARLSELFEEVVAVPYPAEFNPWPDSRHVAFLCRRVRSA